MLTTLRRHIEEVTPLSEEDWSQIAAYFVPRKFRRKQFIVQEFQPVGELYFVVHGLLKSSSIDSQDKEHIIQLASEDWWITDFSAFFNQTRASLSIDCLEDSTLLSLSFEDMNRICQDFPQMEHFFRIKSNKGYITLQQRILSLLTDDARTRYEKFVKEYPQWTQKLPKQIIANYLGVSRETLSRLYKEL